MSFVPFVFDGVSVDKNANVLLAIHRAIELRRKKGSISLQSLLPLHTQTRKQLAAILEERR
jgi:hypothetical protein